MEAVLPLRLHARRVGALAGTATRHKIFPSLEPMIPVQATSRKLILHLCKREMLRPLRDQVLRLSGFEVDSTMSHTEALDMFWTRPYDLVLVDVEGESGVKDAERLCSEIKTSQHHQLVAFICNWRVAIHTECPDEILRTEFDPASFVHGVQELVTH